tara:strand:+ start:3090 stop:3344 length:255 start_codon:yes stop_codon:yes gene_type:complete
LNQVQNSGVILGGGVTGVAHRFVQNETGFFGKFGFGLFVQLNLIRRQNLGSQLIHNLAVDPHKPFGNQLIGFSSGTQAQFAHSL